jgi:hypothetical protein
VNLLKILELFKPSKLIKSYEILDLKTGEGTIYYKINAILMNNTTLFVTEFISKDEIIYSYHWQDKKGNLIRRWDNAPYHKVETFPHHVHIEVKIEPSYETDIEAIPLIIGNLIS